eukprot:Skav219753  [mRNA]  locus=scaffold569:223301:224872:- [translate_table: standard]
MDLTTGLSRFVAHVPTLRVDFLGDPQLPDAAASVSLRLTHLDASVLRRPACGKSHMPEEPKKTIEGDDDDWKALLTTSGASSHTGVEARQSERVDTKETEAVDAETFQAQASSPPSIPPKQDEPYGLLDEYVDDLLGIPLEERPSWQRPSWKQTGSSVDVPEMVLHDGSRGPALQSEAQSQPTPYLEGVLNDWAAIDAEDPIPMRDGPAPKRRVDRAARA